MSKTAVFYGSSTGNTEAAAKEIAKELGADVFDVASNPSDKLEAYDNLVLGSSTWGIGDLQDDWEDFISNLEDANLEGKTVALFGYGDSESYADSYVDAMGTLYNTVKDKGCKLVGAVDTEGYEYEESTAVVDGKFVGLALDEENQGDQTEDRINAWVSSIKNEFN
ncbi:MAG: flavodoxin [Bacteroidetes bacterium]|nr:MAG: flavodoxin [Bacteroidota bacterium]